MAVQELAYLTVLVNVLEDAISAEDVLKIALPFAPLLAEKLVVEHVLEVVVVHVLALA